MSGEKPSGSLDELEQKIRAAEERRGGTSKTKDKDEGRGSALSVALRIGVELVSATFLGAAIGWALDSWLDTKPWFLLLFFLLGSAAGMLNIFRAMSGYGYAAGYAKGERKDAPKRAQKRDGSNDG